MSAATSEPVVVSQADKDFLDEGLRRRVGYLPPGVDSGSLHTLLSQCATSPPERCAGLVVPSFEGCCHEPLARDASGYAVIPAGPMPGTTVVHRGSTGSGKTFYAGRVIEGARRGPQPCRVIVVTPRRTLAHDLARRFDLPCYLDLEPDSEEWLESLVVSPMSLHKVVLPYSDGYAPREPILLILDESEMVAREFASPLWDGHRHAVENLSILLRLLGAAHTVLALDAYAGFGTAALLFWANRLRETTVLVAPEPPPPAVDLGRVQDHLAGVVARVAAGKRLAVACMTKADAETLRVRIRVSSPEVTVGMVTGSERELLSRPPEPGEDLQERFRVDVLIYTQAMATGVSIDLRDHFDEVHVVCAMRPGDVMLALQMYRRVRHPKDRTLHFSGPQTKRPRRFLLDYEAHLRRWTRQDGSGALNPFGRDLPPVSMAEKAGTWTLHRRYLAAVASADGFAWFAGATATGLRVLFGLPLDREEPDERPPSDKEVRDQIRQDRARAVALAVEVPHEATDEDREEADRLAAVFGAEFSEGSRPRRIELALADVSSSKPATERMWLFAFVLLVAHELGERVFDRDISLAERWDIDHRKHHHRRAGLVWFLLQALGVTPAAAWGTVQRYGHAEALGVVRLARGISRNLRLHGLPAPKPKDDAKPHQYVGRLLRQLGLDTVRSQRTVRAVDGTKERVSEYRVSAASVQEQFRRAKHALQELVGKGGAVPPAPLAPWSSPETRPAPVLAPKPAAPPRPTLADLEAAFAPVGLEIDGERLATLSANYSPKPTRTESSAAVLTHLRTCAAEARPLTFSAVFTTDRWPRRTPVWLPDPPAGVLLSPEQWCSVNRSTAVYPANTPREVRSAIAAPEGQTLVMMDLKAAHLALLAAVADDQAMAAWLAGDPHAEIGAALAPSLGAAAQRALGKAVNSAMVNSATLRTIGNCVYEAGAARHLGATTVRDFHAWWWARFPAVAALKAHHDSEVAVTIRGGLPLRIEVDGELVLAYPADALSGARKVHGWPDTPEKRREKALRSSWAARVAALESVVMDEVVLAAHRIGLRMAMPMFDGMVWVAPEADAAKMASALGDAVQGILDRRGIPTVGEVEVRRTWGTPIDL